MKETKETRKTIRYYNILITCFLKEEKDFFAYHLFEKTITQGLSMRLRDLTDWCNTHGISYRLRFYYRKDFPLRANLWNLYSYFRFLAQQRLVKTGGTSL